MPLPACSHDAWSSLLYPLASCPFTVPHLAVSAVDIPETKASCVEVRYTRGQQKGVLRLLCDGVDNASSQGQGHSLLQLAANPISSLCCALVALRSTAHVSAASSSDRDQSSASASSSVDLDPVSAVPQESAGTTQQEQYIHDCKSLLCTNSMNFAM